MSYTRLFQNSAKVHFDELRTDGKPLVYGGFPLSVAYAQAFNGLENRSGDRRDELGRARQPCYAGTTIYSYTDVLETHALGDAPAGALRLRLVARQGRRSVRRSRTSRCASPTARGGERYNPRVLLDMDYFELMPKRGR